MGSALVLYTIAFGLEKAERKVPDKVFRLRREVLLCFLFMGFVTIFMGYDILKLRELGTYAHLAGQTITVDLLNVINIGIAMKVAVTLISLFHVFIKEDY